MEIIIIYMTKLNFANKKASKWNGIEFKASRQSILNIGLTRCNKCTVIKI